MIEDSALQSWQDPIVAGVRAARASIWADVGADLDHLVRRLREEQEASGRQVVSLPPRRPLPESDAA